jgi:hypothetical protein
MSGNVLAKQIFDGHGPAGNGGFGFGELAATVDRRVVRTARAVNPDDFLAKHIHVPNHTSAGGEIILALGGHLAFRSWTIVVFAAYFDGEDWSALQEFARVRGPL